MSYPFHIYVLLCQLSLDGFCTFKSVSLLIESNALEKSMEITYIYFYLEALFDAVI